MTARALDYSDKAFTWCTRCEKKTWPSRRAARRAAKRHHPGHVLNAYPCPHQHVGWHYGHLRPDDRDIPRRTA
ncbi:hypothetical protein F9C11_21650 [Amycolatopsis sp. VS8301801F10]|uniref:hypothetical protein n=1 Tax=Amycolatopsis sp. VS8301801F10 TaxID=2652442 RepID=UPI0038FC2F33